MRERKILSLCLLHMVPLQMMSLLLERADRRQQRASWCGY